MYINVQNVLFSKYPADEKIILGQGRLSKVSLPFGLGGQTAQDIVTQ